jgi:hypothetical protein
MGTSGGRRLRVVFPDGVWRADVEARYPPGSGARNTADIARRDFERDGVPESQLLACDPEGPEGSRLEDCLKAFRSGRAIRLSARSGSCSSTSEPRNQRYWCSRLASATPRRNPGNRASISSPTAGFTHRP